MLTKLSKNFIVPKVGKKSISLELPTKNRLGNLTLFMISKGGKFLHTSHHVAFSTRVAPENKTMTIKLEKKTTKSYSIRGSVRDPHVSLILKIGKNTGSGKPSVEFIKVNKPYIVRYFIDWVVTRLKEFLKYFLTTLFLILITCLGILNISNLDNDYQLEGWGFEDLYGCQEYDI